MAETWKKSAQTKMQLILARLGIPLKVAWVTDGNHEKHGLIEESSGTIFIFDETESEAWATFIHEILEFKLIDVTRTYRLLINGLIEVFERLMYNKKETFLESIPEILKTIEEQRTNNVHVG